MSATGNHGRGYLESVTALVISSPRARRRLAWLAGAAVLAGAIAAASALLPSRNAALEADDSPAVAKPAAQPARAYGEPKTVPAPRKELNALLDAFIPAVIARKDLAGGWNLVTADARGSRAEWMRGTTPFQNFQARAERYHGWTVNYSYPGDVGFDIFLAPKDPRDISIAFRGEAKKERGAWKIAVFYPQATFQPAGKKAFVWADTDLQPQAVGGSANEGRLSAAWLLFPAGIFAAALVGGVGFAVVRGLRRRARVKRIERELALMR
jgi:hypothetical protein